MSQRESETTRSFHTAPNRPDQHTDRPTSTTSDSNSGARRSQPNVPRSAQNTATNLSRQRHSASNRSSRLGTDEYTGPGDTFRLNDLPEEPNIAATTQSAFQLREEQANRQLRTAQIMDDARSETTVLPLRDLNMYDVAALILNKQIGTGIFTTPGLVLSLTGSKPISIVMWFAGGLWAFLSVVIYVEFGTVFPFNGGELIYLDEVLRRPELLAVALFSAFFLFIPNTDGNSLQFAKHVLLAAEPSVLKTEDLDQRLVSLVAVCILTVVSLMHYFSRKFGLFLNSMFAMYKVALLVVFIIAGGTASRQQNNGKSDWAQQEVSYQNYLAAMIYIIYSYQGWEDANYVGGELKVASHDLKWGAFLAVLICTVLYTLLAAMYALACPFGELAGQDLGIVSYFAPKAFGPNSVMGVKVCIALSAFGNLVAVIYTSARVKQQIARQCIIPFYKFFSKEDRQFETPGPALLLHWIATFIWILCTPNTTDGYGFVIGLFIYGQLVVGVFVGLAFFGIRRNFEADLTRTTTVVGGTVEWTPVVLKSLLSRSVVGCVFIMMNLAVIFGGALPSQATPQAGQPKSIPAWLKPTVLFSWLGFAMMCFCVLKLLAWRTKKSGGNHWIDVRIVKDGDLNLKPEDHTALSKAKSEGNVRIVVYEVHGALQRFLESAGGVLMTLLKVVTR